MRTGLKRKLKWWMSKGHKRLAAAQLRRKPLKYQYDLVPHLSAIRYMVGAYVLGSIIIDFTIGIPDAVQRIQAYRSLARKLTSPNWDKVKPSHTIDLGREPRSPSQVFKDPPSFSDQ